MGEKINLFIQVKLGEHWRDLFARPNKLEETKEEMAKYKKSNPELEYRILRETVSITNEIIE